MNLSGRVMAPSPASIPVLSGFQDIASQFDVALCDIWGVLHNGVKAYAAASAALKSFREQGGTVILVSNAPRPGLDVVPLLDKFGVDRLAYDGIVTSGDVTHTMLKASKWKSYHWIGPERDGELFRGLTMKAVSIDEADVVVCTGLLDDTTEKAENYRATCEAIRKRNLPFLCANPDIVVERGSEIIHCAGAIAQIYEEIGGEVIYAGKPYKPVYDAALDVASSLNRKLPDLKRTLMIGDAIRTDVAGARNLGCASLFVMRGIHMHELGLHQGALQDGSFERFIATAAYKPDYAIDMLSW